MTQRQIDGGHLGLHLAVADIAVPMLFEDTTSFEEQAFPLPREFQPIDPRLLHRGHHPPTHFLAPVLREGKAFQQGTKLLPHQICADLQKAACWTGNLPRLRHVFVITPLGPIGATTAQGQSAVNIGDKAGKLVDFARLRGAAGRLQVELGTGADFLPLAEGERGLMQPTIALAVMQHGAPIIIGREGRIEGIAHDGVDGVFGKEALPKAFAPGAIASGIDGIRNAFGIHPLHTQFPDQAQPWKGGGIRFEGRFGTGTPIAKGHIAIEESLGGALAFALAGVFGEHVRKIRREGRQNGELEPTLRAGIINMLGDGDKRRLMLGQNAEALQRHHDIARPAVQRVDHHDLDAPGFYIFEQLLERGTFGDLLAAGAELIILVKDRRWQPALRAPITERSFLRIDAEVILLHLARTTDIASHDRRGVAKGVVTQGIHSVLLFGYQKQAQANQGRIGGVDHVPPFLD